MLSLVLNDLREELLRTNEIKYENYSLQNKWDKLRILYGAVMDYKQNGGIKDREKVKNAHKKIKDIAQGMKTERFQLLKTMLTMFDGA